MYTKRIFVILIAALIGGVLLFATLSQLALAGDRSPTGVDTTRTGAWVDTVHISTIPTATNAIDALETGDIHFYTPNLTDPALYQRVESNPDLVAYRTTNNFHDLTLNPAGPVFSGTGKLNPFDVPEIREALNWLIDRDAIAQAIYGGLAVPRFFCLNTQQTEYARYYETIQDLEAAYDHDPVKAETVIAAEMLKLGATLVSDRWYYNAEPVELIFIIRVEDERTQIGDYIADQLESIGFTVNRWYLTGSEADQYWLISDPDEGTWHLYIPGWVSTYVSRDESSNFGYFYTSLGYDAPLWQAYTPTPEFYEIAETLYYRDYADMNERDQLFSDALALSLQDSSRVWLIDERGFSPRRAEVTAAYDLVSGLFGSDLWPYTVRFIGLEGGVVNIAQPSIFNDPWNPVGGSNWGDDKFVERSLQDKGVVIDPNTGLAWPQRVESAELYVQPGAAVNQTLGWVNLAYSDTIAIPGDAWVDWDAVNQEWITAAEAFTETHYANLKSVVRYPADLYTTVTWHDDSPISAADFIMAMILPFELGDPTSAIYDESRADELDNFKSTFRGYRITSLDPLEIEVYTDANPQLDAELTIWSLWPEYALGEANDRGEAPWHTVALGVRAEAAGSLAFTQSKAYDQGIEWMDFLTEPSLTSLSSYLADAQSSEYIPYANTLSAYITPAEAAARWANLDAWVDAYGHFWVGAGPFYLESYSHQDGSLTLQRYPAFPDLADKWEAFSHDPTPASIEINYDTGAPGSAFNITGANYPINSFGDISVNDSELGTIFTGATGSFTFTLTTDLAAQEGTYYVTVSVNPSDTTAYTLDAGEPTRPVEGDYEMYLVPQETIAYTNFIYLPVLLK